MEVRVLYVFLLLCASLNFNNGVADLTSDEVNKFREPEASDALGFPNLDENILLNKHCPQNLKLRWQIKVNSSMRAAPLIADINSDGKLDVVVPSLVHYLEVLEGSNGDRMPGWPAFHGSIVHASPLLYDIDKDGVREIALATYNGEILFFRISGYLMSDKLVVPQFKMNRNFHEDLFPDPIGSSGPDIHDDKLMEEVFLNFIPIHKDMANASKEDNQEKQNSSQIEADIKLLQTINDSYQEERTRNAESGTNSRRRFLQDHDTKGSEQSRSGSIANKAEDFLAATVEVELSADSNFDYEDYVDKNMSKDEKWTAVQHDALESYVNIDSHILCTPVIADIDNDGVSEMIVAASYFFDHEYYDNPEHLKELGVDDTRKYVAGGIVAFNLETKQVKWTADLDVSTDTAEFRAYIYSSPTVVDLDGDGNLDILVGTSYGSFYVLDHTGKVRDNFPLEMAEIQGAMVAADINNDGEIELVTTDTRGNVVAWSSQGNKIWEANLKSLIPQGPTIGDVDGDGHTDMIVPTLSGRIFVLRGKDGSHVHPYPYRTQGRVTNRILHVDLTKRGERKNGLTIVTTSSDGRLYLIDGQTLCADFVDIGETSYSMVVADNVDGGDDIDLIVPTINGSVFCFSTGSPFHPLKAWRSPDQGKNNAANRFNREGIYVTPSSRAFRDEGGKTFSVDIEIVDRYRSPSGSQAPYNVTTTLLVPGNTKGNKIIQQNQVFDHTGKYRIKLPTVLEVRTTATVLVEMVDKNGLYFSDDFSLKFHKSYYKILKWLLLLLLLGMLGVLVILRPQEARPVVLFPKNLGL